MNQLFKTFTVFLIRQVHFLWKISKIWTSFTKISEFFRKIIIFWGALEIQWNLLWMLFQLPQPNWLRSMANLWKGDENSGKFLRKSTVICEEIHENQNFVNNFHQEGKIKKPASKVFLKFRPKMKKILKKILRFFTEYFWNFCLLRCIRLENKTGVLQQFYRIRGDVPV